MDEWDERKAWLEKLQVGDEVAIRYNYGHSVRIRKVERLTQTLIVVDGSKFRRSDGQAPGIRYDNPHLEIPTAELRRKIELSEAVAMLQHQIQWRNMPEDVIMEVSRIVREAKAKAQRGTSASCTKKA